ncbi:hypothetical protein J6590_032722 [Homalodisca vitripennis]|nr:hypothetical protein J6590_032722 [Homalodisca vitripennis]
MGGTEELDYLNWAESRDTHIQESGSTLVTFVDPLIVVMFNEVVIGGARVSLLKRTFKTDVQS